ncbi:hypothetical protein [Flagellimonas beolgyonensis]|uniref:hypothetical protein n=1 Tax=Flagellimonas beolgyonensis TaxID=864064 RepID=UPI000F8DABD5|nr:hypothetical protein [Allomuricauda beolgyonensis]
MIDGLTFLNQKLLLPILLGGILVFGFFVWKEWPQKGERRFWIKLAIGFIGLVALALLVLKPAVPQMVSGKKSIILTEGYRQAQLDSLTKLYKRISIESYQPGKLFSKINPNDTLFVLGYGLEPFDFWLVEQNKVDFLGAEPLVGWTAIHYKPVIELGDILSLQTEYTQSKEGHWALLYDNGGNALDSVEFSGETLQKLTFKVEPKASGRFEFALVEKDAQGEVISQEPIPFQVLEPDPLQVLIINTFPTFETKYLKNFLAENGHGVVVRSQLTKGRYKFEYFNTEAVPVYQLSENELQSFDLVIIDADSYLELNKNSREALDKNVKDEGLGLYVQPSGPLFNQAGRKFPLSFERDGVQELRIEGTQQTLEKFPFRLKEEILVEPIQWDAAMVGALARQGMGKVGTILLQDSYQLILDGKQEMYSALWSTIVDAMAKTKVVGTAWETKTPFPSVDQPFQFILKTDRLEPEVSSGRGTVPLLQDLQIPTHWKGTTYPTTAGWNALAMAQDSLPAFYYYVFQKDSRKAEHQKWVQQLNQRQFGKMGTKADTRDLVKKRAPLNSIWFFIVFLLCMGWLWLEPKLHY